MNCGADPRVTFTKAFVDAIHSQYGGTLRNVYGTFPSLADTIMPGTTLSFFLTRANQQRNPRHQQFIWNFQIAYPKTMYRRKEYVGQLFNLREGAGSGNAAAAIVEAVKAYYVPDGVSIIIPAKDRFRTIGREVPMETVLRASFHILAAHTVNPDFRLQIDLEENRFVRIHTRITDESRFLVVPT